MKSDELAFLERAAVAEEVASLLRHDVRNKLASVRNASFYLQRCVAKTDLWQSNPRIQQFFELIVTELGAASEILDQRASFGHLFGTRRSTVRAGVCLERALRSVSLPSGVTLDQRLEDSLTLEVAPEEIELAIGCLLENALEAMAGSGVLSVRSFDRDGSVVVEIADTGPGFSTDQRQAGVAPLASTKAGHLGLGLGVVRRIVERYEGTLSLGERGGHALVELLLPASART